MRPRRDQQKTLAEQRSKDIVDLAGRALFDVHDAIATLPGSVDARRTKTTLEYLQNVRKQQGMNDEMRQALAAGYYKVANIQGDPLGSSLQDFTASEASLLERQKILRPAYNRYPENPDFMLCLIEIRSSLARLTYRSGREREAIPYYLDLLPVAHRLASLKNCSLVCKTQEPILENSLATDLMTIDAAQALEHAQRGIALDRALLKQYPGDTTLEQALGAITAAAAEALRNLGEFDKALQQLHSSIGRRNDSARQGVGTG